MKVYQLMDYFSETGERPLNPYVSILMDGISNLSDDVEWFHGVDFLWDDRVFDMDIIHTHWLGFMKASKMEVERFRQRFKVIKEKGIKIVATVHNLEKHYSKSEEGNLYYTIVYSHADVFVHLGDYSKKLFEQRYPNAQHVMIPHHVYDHEYPDIPNRKASLRKLHLSSRKKYVLCFGFFRDEEELKMVDTLANEVHKHRIEVLVPHYYTMKKWMNRYKRFKRWVKMRLRERQVPGLHIYGWDISHELLPFFFGAADAVLIQRKKILNSGNLPMAFLMGKVCIGPNIGNVGGILTETGNSTFDPSSTASLCQAVYEGLRSAASGKGEQNREYALRHWSTDTISAEIYHLYRKVLATNGKGVE
jgi:glycosyltransferase involved in cell wall biosynthesis